MEPKKTEYNYTFDCSEIRGVTRNNRKLLVEFDREDLPFWEIPIDLSKVVPKGTSLINGQPAWQNGEIVIPAEPAAIRIRGEEICKLARNALLAMTIE